MKIGEVTPNKEAIVKIDLISFDGHKREVVAVLDTGFTEYLTLPPTIITDLGLQYQYSIPMILADGSSIAVRVFDAIVIWADIKRSIPVQETLGDVLLGMSMIYGFRLNVDALDGGAVTITQIS